MKRIIGWLVFLLVAATLGAAGWYGVNGYKETTAQQIPLAKVRFGEFLAIVRCRGELKAGRSMQIYVPLIPSLRIAWIAQSGELVNEGDPVIRFDSSTAQQEIIQKQGALAQAPALTDPRSATTPAGTASGLQAAGKGIWRSRPGHGALSRSHRP